MKKSRMTHRMPKILMLSFTVMFVVLFGRFMYIQATGEINGVDLEKWAEKKRKSSYKIDADRGRILDRNGMVLAYDRPTYNIYAIIDENYSEGLEEPIHVSDADKTAEQLAPLLDISEQSIKAQLEKEGRFQVEFGSKGRNLSQEKMEEIKALDLPGIKFNQEAKRYYPNGEFASHVIGFAQRKEEDQKLSGIIGIERQMNEKLTETNGYISYQRDKYNKKLLDPDEIVREPKDGANIELTIDQKIQTFLEDAMAHVAKQYEPERMMAVVMDPKTGEVLALSNRPSFNPNVRENIQNWYNDVISYPYEPGSTMKMFTYAAAIDAGVYKGQEKFMSGSFKLDERNKAIRDHKPQGWGEITYDEGFMRSSNVAAAKLVWEKLQPERYLEYLKAFNINDKTGIDLPGEGKGRILYDWPIEKVTTSYGQGSTVTPIQQMMAATAIANNGKMMRPYVISKVTSADNEEIIHEGNSEVVGEPIKPSTAKQVRDLLETVVIGEHGTGKSYKLNDYSVAGKTGTAQIPDPDTGGYLRGKENHIFSFLGMAPKEDPKLIMYVSVKQPKLEDTEYGPEPVSYIFKTVMENSLHYLNIKPDQKEKSTNVTPQKLPDVKGKTTKKAKKELAKIDVDPIIVGEGSTVIEMRPRPNRDVLANERIILLTSNKVKIPDMNGWSLRDTLKLSDMLDLKVEHIGNGFVYKQSVKKGSIIQKGDYLVVELKPPSQPQNEEDSEENNERTMHEIEQSDEE